MTRKYSISDLLLVCTMVTALFFPIYYSKVNLSYSPDGVLPNALALLTMGAMVLERKLRWQKRDWFSLGIVVLLAGFNLFQIYCNAVYHGWYAGQLNATIPVLLFLLLTLQKEEHPDMAPVFVKLFVISNAIGLIPYFLGYSFFDARIQVLEFLPFSDSFDELRYSWIFLHKSQYALMLLIGLGLVVTYRRVFRNKWTWLASIAVLLVGLVISNARTSMVVSLFIFGGMLLDYIAVLPKPQRKKYMLAFIPLLAVLAVLVAIITQRRNIWTLGGRIYIWQYALPFIRWSPYGLARACGIAGYAVPDWPYTVYNCHNVFLNLILQFSIPGGGLLVGVFGWVALAGALRNRSFRTLGIMAVMLVAMCMDWSLLLTDMTLFFVAVYFLFFSSQRISNETIKKV